MIFYFSKDGGIIFNTPSTVVQGTSSANKIYYVAPTHPGNTVTVGFNLPNGKNTAKYLLTLQSGTGLNGISDADGNTFYVWERELPARVTKQAGLVTCQFYVTNASGGVLATDSVVFPVDSGVTTITEPEDVTEDITNILSQYLTVINNGLAEKRDLYNPPTDGEYVYSVKKAGNERTESGIKVISENAEGGTVVKRDSQGNIKVYDEQYDSDNAASEGYVRRLVRPITAQVDTHQTGIRILNEENAIQQSQIDSLIQKVENAYEVTRTSQLINDSGYITKTVDDLVHYYDKEEIEAQEEEMRDFVNSSIGTNTAYYISDDGEPFSSLETLEAYSGPLTNNDYAFVVGTDEAGNTTYTRYKYNAEEEEWAEEYVLNNSSFTAEQWAAINSGITSGDVTYIKSLPAILANLNNLNIENGKGNNSVQQKQAGYVTYESAKDWETGDPYYTANLEAYKDENGNVIPGAYGNNSAMENGRSVAIGEYSSAEGQSSISPGIRSKAINTKNAAVGQNTFAQGALGVAEGKESVTLNYHNYAKGGAAFAAGSENKAIGDISHVEGSRNVAGGRMSHVEGTGNKTKAAEGNDNGGYVSHVEGSNNTVNSPVSHAEGSNNIVDAQLVHVEGSENRSSGTTSHVEGFRNNGSGAYMHIEGANNTGSGIGAHIEGNNNDVTGQFSHSEGSGNIVTGNNAHVEGGRNTANGDSSHVEGSNNRTLKEIKASSGGGGSSNGPGLVVGKRYKFHGTMPTGHGSTDVGITFWEIYCTNVENINNQTGSSANYGGSSSNFGGSAIYLSFGNYQGYSCLNDSTTKKRYPASSVNQYDVGQAFYGAFNFVYQGYSSNNMTVEDWEAIRARIDEAEPLTLTAGTVYRFNGTMPTGGPSIPFTTIAGIETLSSETGGDGSTWEFGNSVLKFGDKAYSSFTGTFDFTYDDINGPITLTGDYAAFDDLISVSPINVQGNNAHAKGAGTTAFGHGAKSSGVLTLSYGEAASSDGYETQSGTLKDYILYDKDVDVSGNTTTTYRIPATKSTHTEGIGTKATVDGQSVAGKYNKPNANALFIVGNGTNENNRHNALEVLEDGSILVNEEKLGSVKSYKHSLTITFPVMEEPNAGYGSNCYATIINNSNKPITSLNAGQFVEFDYYLMNYRTTIRIPGILSDLIVTPSFTGWFIMSLAEDGTDQYINGDIYSIDIQDVITEE